MVSSLSSAKTLVVVDHISGHNSQARGLAYALSSHVTEISASYGRGMMLPNWVPIPHFFRFTADFRDRSAKIAHEPPNIIISAGRRAALASLYLQKSLIQSNKSIKSIQILDPGVKCTHFNQVLMPEHAARPKSENLVNFPVPAHDVTENRLNQAKIGFKSLFSPLKSPVIGILVGGNHKKGALSLKNIDYMVDMTSLMRKNQPISVITSSSRRTPSTFFDHFCSRVQPDYAYDAGRLSQSEPNPYAGILAWSDGLIVTGESISMVAEAVATRAPVFVLAPPNLVHPKGKHRRFLDDLLTKQLVYPLSALEQITDLKAFAAQHRQRLKGQDFEPYLNPSEHQARLVRENLDL